MDYVPNSLNLMIKERRKEKEPFPSHIRKVIIFQLFKGLYYMQVNCCFIYCSWIIFVIGISSHQIFLLMMKHMRLKFVILGRLKYYKKNKRMSLTLCRDIIGLRNLSWAVILMALKLMYGQQGVLLLSFLLWSPSFPETAQFNSWSRWSKF